MFYGSIPQDVRNMVIEIVQAWHIPDVYVACSGNFTIERILATLNNRFRLHGNDIQIYSCAMGAYFAGQPLQLSFKPFLAETLPFLADALTTPTDQLATLMLLSRFPYLFTQDDHLRDNAYYRRVLDGLRVQWAGMHNKTTEKLLALPLKLTSFAATDAVAWMDSIPREAGFCSYPPFFGADKTYQRDFAKLDALIEWVKPVAPPITTERMNAMLEQATQRDHWLLVSNQPLPNYEASLRGKAQSTNRGAHLYLYASRAQTRIAVPRQKTQAVIMPRLAPTQTLGTDIKLHDLPSPQFSAMRSQYLNAFIRPGTESKAYAVSVDGALVGVFAISASPSFDDYVDMSSIYLMSDFPVAPTQYPRLSKLVLYAALSKEAQMLYERVARHRIRRVTTTAFANKPVSMKYRGIFDLHNRKDLDTTHSTPSASNPYNQKYALQYKASCGGWTLAEGLDLWRKKFGQLSLSGDTHD